jgi:hypothetical protein
MFLSKKCKPEKGDGAVVPYKIKNLKNCENFEDPLTFDEISSKEAICLNGLCYNKNSLDRSFINLKKDPKSRREINDKNNLFPILNQNSSRKKSRISQIIDRFTQRNRPHINIPRETRDEREINERFRITEQDLEDPIMVRLLGLSYNRGSPDDPMEQRLTERLEQLRTSGGKNKKSHKSKRFKRKRKKSKKIKNKN